MISGTNITLKTLDAEEADNLRSWVNSQDNLEYIGKKRPINELEHHLWFEKISQDMSKIFLAIYHKPDNTHIGCIFVDKIDYSNSKAKIFLIANCEAIAHTDEMSESLTLTKDYCFKNLNLNKIYSCLPARNSQLKTIFEHSGFAIEATLKEEIFTGGNYEDLHIISIFRNPKEQKSEPKSIADAANTRPDFQWFQSQKKLKISENNNSNATNI